MGSFRQSLSDFSLRSYTVALWRQNVGRTLGSGPVQVYPRQVSMILVNTGAWLRGPLPVFTFPDYTAPSVPSLRPAGGSDMSTEG